MVPTLLVPPIVMAAALLAVPILIEPFADEPVPASMSTDPPVTVPDTAVALPPCRITLPPVHPVPQVLLVSEPPVSVNDEPVPFAVLTEAARTSDVAPPFNVSTPEAVILPMFIRLPLLSTRVIEFVCNAPPVELILPLAVSVPVVLMPEVVTLKYVVVPALFWTSSRFAPIGVALSRTVSAPRVASSVDSGLVELLYAVCNVTPTPLQFPEVVHIVYVPAPSAGKLIVVLAVGVANPTVVTFVLFVAVIVLVALPCKVKLCPVEPTVKAPVGVIVFTLSVPPTEALFVTLSDVPLAVNDDAPVKVLADDPL